MRGGQKLHPIATFQGDLAGHAATEEPAAGGHALSRPDGNPIWFCRGPAGWAIRVVWGCSEYRFAKNGTGASRRNTSVGPTISVLASGRGIGGRRVLPGGFLDLDPKAIKMPAIKIKWQSTDAGGRKHPPPAGKYFSVARFSDDSKWQDHAWSVVFQLSRHETVEGHDFSSGTVEFLMPDAPSHKFDIHTTFDIYEGPHKVGTVHIQSLS